MEIPTKPVKLNIGAGDVKLEGWLTAGLQDDHDIKCDIRSIPLEDESVDEAMAIHVLEHLERFDAPDAINEWFRILKKGGTLTLELPDLLKICRNIIDGMEPRYGILGLFGDPKHKDPLMMHRWGWTVEEVKKELKAAGFKKIKIEFPQFHGRRTARDMRLVAYK